MHAHESFLPLHHHPAAHDHESHAAHVHGDVGGKEGHAHLNPAAPEHRFAFATGVRYTRYSVEGEPAHLWEAGLGIDYAVLPWLHLGGDLTHGWYDSHKGGADGLMSPQAHLDFHLPLGGPWELIAGLEVSFPGGDEALVGRHWELAPHAELRYDRGGWFAEAEVSLDFAIEDEGHHEHGDEHESGGHSGDFHEIVEPHGERELQYLGALGVRLLDRRLTVAARLAGVHVLAGETPADNYLRAGLRTSWQLHERVLVTAEASLPITDAERNQWQTSIGLRVGF